MQPVYAAQPAPTEPEQLGPYLVVPQPIPDSVHTRYSIFVKGRKVGEQISRPDLDQCAMAESRARAAAAVGAVKRRQHVYNNVPTQICRTCRKTKSLRQFYRLDHNGNARMADCMTCYGKLRDR